jgi:endonuclease-3
MSTQDRAQHIFQQLREAYPEVSGTSLSFHNALELLIATILSAQCPDDRVNAVTPALFETYVSAADYAAADLEALQALIKPTGFYRRKAKLIKEATTMLVDIFDGKVPQSLAELTRLPGVARKTANIVVSNAFGVVEGIAVDTHVMRLAQRLGLSTETNRNKIERDFMTLFPQEQWPLVADVLITHGRAICQARRPNCAVCVVQTLCPSAFTFD